MPPELTDDGDSKSLTVRIGREEVVVRHRYEVLSIINDVFIGLWFTVGSVLFFSESTMTVATALFLIGSTHFLLRPLIRLGRRIHVNRARSASGAERPGDLADDY